VDKYLRDLLVRVRNGGATLDEGLLGLARAGFTRDVRSAQVREALEWAFVGQLDFERVGEEYSRSEPEWFLFRNEVEGEGELTRARLLRVRVGDGDFRWESCVPVWGVASGRLVRNYSVQYRGYRGQGFAHWCEVAPETLEPSLEHMLYPSVEECWVARRRFYYQPVVRVGVWYPSRAEVLSHGDLWDVRLVVDAHLHERAEVLETVMEAFPHGTVVSLNGSAEGCPSRGHRWSQEMGDNDEVDWDPMVKGFADR
jgi:hypothetical protein